MSLRAILIDLDNTLVLYDESAFHQTTEAMVVDYSAHPDNYEGAFLPDGSGTLAEVIPFIDKLNT